MVCPTKAAIKIRIDLIMRTWASDVGIVGARSEFAPKVATADSPVAFAPRRAMPPANKKTARTHKNRTISPIFGFQN